ETSWRMMKYSTPIASRFQIVSSRLSPLRREEEAVEKPSTSAERRRAAISKELRVRVEGSEKISVTSRPERALEVLEFLKEAAASRIDSISEALKACSPSRSFRFQIFVVGGLRSLEKSRSPRAKT